MNKTPDLLAALRAEIVSAPAADLPAIIGQIEAVKAEAFSRLVSPLPAANVDPVSDGTAEAADTALTVEEVALRLGQKVQWVRAHQRELPRIHLPGRTVRFSARKLDAWMKRRTA